MEVVAVTVDPVLLEVIRNGFVAAADEMRINLMRTSYNPIIYEVLDFSVGLFDSCGDMIAQAAGLPVFLGNLGAAVKTVIADAGPDFRPGDLYLINDMYTTGTHSNDVTVVSPMFGEGCLAGFAVSRAHWLDVGGKDPGGSCDCTDIFGEGLRLRSVALYRAGRRNESVWRILRDNVRNPDSQLGDLRAQVAAGRTGEARFSEIVSRFGLNTVLAANAELKRQGELRTRQALALIPDGVYRHEAYLDNDVVTDEPCRVCAAVTINGDSIHIDLTGCSGQRTGPVNCSYPATVSACRVVLKAITDPFGPVNEGCFEPLEVYVPEDSMFNAHPPAAGFVNGITDILLCDVILTALASAIPDRIPAAHYGDMAGFMIYGHNPSGMWIQQEPEGGGWGACPHRDGEPVLIFIADGDTRNVPCEVIENRYPLRMERYELRSDSGGPGRYRGGLGHHRDYRLLADGFMSGIMGRSVCPPWGLFGGQSAQHGVFVHNPGPDEKHLMTITAYPLTCGDVVSVRTGGGGGYGDPLDRGVQEVAADVRAGYVTAKQAQDSYGVVIGPDGDVDANATAAERSIRSGRRTGS